MGRDLKANGSMFSDRWPTCFATALWWQWRWRNSKAFGRENDIPLYTGEFIRNQVEDVWNAFHNPKRVIAVSRDQQKLRREIFVKWQAPPYDWTVLNTDGASKGTPRQACGGGLMRDKSGACLGGFIASFGVCTAYKAELLAAELGLELAMRKNVSKLVLQMGRQACIEALKNPKFQGGECYHILNNCPLLLNSSKWPFYIVHCYREGNKVADKLANLGVIQRERVAYFDVAPSEINSLLREDIIGVVLPRLVV